MLRARTSSGMDFAGFPTESSRQKRQRLAVQRKILFCRHRWGGCIQGTSGQEDEQSGCRVAARKIPRTLILQG